MNTENNIEIKVSNIVEEVKTIDETNDIFDTYSKAKSICEFLALDANKEVLAQNNLIAIYGSWGVGKSCLMKTIQENLDANKFETVWFDTWKYEKDDNLPYSLLKFIGKEKFWDKFKEKSVNTIGILYGLFKSIAKGTEIELGIKNLATATIKPGEYVQALEDTAKEMNKQIDDEMCLWEKVKIFEDEFINLQVTEDENKRLVVFLDDLDRCESENIITLMSSIKLLLSINPNIIFILGIDKTAVTSALRNKYHNTYNKAEEYLEKIFPITFEITSNVQSQKFHQYVAEITELSPEDSKMIVEFFEEMDFYNARHIKKILRKYYFMKGYLKEKGFDLKNKYNIIFVLYNIILSIFFNDEYQKFILLNKENVYENIELVDTDSKGNTFSCNFNTRQISITDSVRGKSYELYKFLLRFSSYKIKNNTMKCSILGYQARIVRSTWIYSLENSICKRFIELIISEEEFLNMFFEKSKSENKMIFKDAEYYRFIKEINNVM